MRQRLRLATANPGKAAELRRLVCAILVAGGLEGALDLADLAGLGPVAVDEDRDSYLGNAEKKARAVAALDPAAAVLADDSGIEVEALGGQPGLRSARWATGPDGTALDGRGLNAALLARLAGLPLSRRSARMVSATALVLPDGSLHAGLGEVRGSIAADQRGPGGFGYDAVFLLPDGGRLSEVPDAVKDALGHRGGAVRAVGAVLVQWVRACAREV